MNGLQARRGCMCDTPLGVSLTRLSPKSRVAFLTRPGTSLARSDALADSCPSWKAEMSEIPRETVLRAVLPILSEAFAGPADPRSTHFANNEPDCGLFGTLDALTAEQASTPVEDGGATAAAQAEHVRFSLDVSARWMRGEREKADWARSWDVMQVDDDAWTELR